MSFEWGKDSTPINGDFQWGRDSVEVPSVGESVARGAAQGATLGFNDEAQGAIQALLRKYVQGSDSDSRANLSDLYQQERDNARREYARAEEAHPVASAIGGAVGGAPLALATVGSGLAGALKGGIGIGAASGLGGSNASTLAGMATDTVKGGAIGAGGTLIGHGVGEALTRAAPGVSDTLAGIANKRAVSALKPTAGEVKTLIREGRMDELGDWLLRSGAVEGGDTIHDIIPKIKGIQAEAGTDYRTALGRLDASGAQLEKAALAEKLEALATAEEKRGPGAAALARRYRDAANAVRDSAADSYAPGGQSLTLSEGEGWKQGYQAPVNYGKQNPTVAQMGDKEIASAARQAVEEAADKSAAKGDAAQWLAAKKDYGSAATAGDMLEGAQGREAARNMLAPTTKAMGIGAALTAVATGHPALAVPALGYAAANHVLAPRAAATVAVAAKSASDKLMSLAQNNPQALGKYGAILGRALSEGGQQAFDAHSYALSQSDPEFQALQKQLSDKH